MSCFFVFLLGRRGEMSTSVVFLCVFWAKSVAGPREVLYFCVVWNRFLCVSVMAKGRGGVNSNGCVCVFPWTKWQMGRRVVNSCVFVVSKRQVS